MSGKTALFWVIIRIRKTRPTNQKLLLTSNGWPITRKSHILKLPALAPNRSSNHSLNCTWETCETCHQCAFVPGERCTWSQWTAKAWASSVEQKRCTRGRRRRRETRSWSLRHETNLMDYWPSWCVFGKNLLQEGVYRYAEGTIDALADSSFARTLKSLWNSTNRGRSLDRQNRAIPQRCLSTNGRQGSLLAARWCDWGSPAWK